MPRLCTGLLVLSWYRPESHPPTPWGRTGPTRTRQGDTGSRLTHRLAGPTRYSCVMMTTGKPPGTGLASPATCPGAVPDPRRAEGVTSTRPGALSSLGSGDPTGRARSRQTQETSYNVSKITRVGKNITRPKIQYLQLTETHFFKNYLWIMEN